jgi:hypothetical protein
MLSDSNPIISKINYETRRPNKQDNDSVNSQTPYFLSKTKLTTYDPYPENKKIKPRRIKNNKKLKRTLKLTRKKKKKFMKPNSIKTRAMNKSKENPPKQMK